jgi:hypothetical protein
MFKKIKIPTLLIITIILIFSPMFVGRAQSFPENNMILTPLTEEGGVAAQAGYAAVDENSPRTIVANIVKVVLGFTGIIFLILIITSGYQWMTAEGNEEKVASAKKRVSNATIGLILIIFAYSIFSFFFAKLCQILSS